MSSNKLILVIGATGAQGIAVVRALVAPNAVSQGFQVRALTRDVNHRRAKELEALGTVELFQGVQNVRYRGH